MSRIRASAAADFITISGLMPKLVTVITFPHNRTIFSIMTPSITAQALNIIGTISPEVAQFQTSIAATERPIKVFVRKEVQRSFIGDRARSRMGIQPHMHLSPYWFLVAVHAGEAQYLTMWADPRAGHSSMGRERADSTTAQKFKNHNLRRDHRNR